MKWVTLMSKRRNYPLIFVPGLWTLKERYQYSFNKWEDGLADTYASYKEMKQEKARLVKAIESDSFWVEEFVLWAIERHNQGLDMARKVFRENLLEKSNSELADLLIQLFRTQEYGKAVICLEIDTQIQDEFENFLITKIKNRKELVKVIEKFTAPTRMSAELRKRLEFLEILNDFQKNGMASELKKKVTCLVENYGWIGVSTGGKPLTNKEIEQLLKKEKTINARLEIKKILDRYQLLKNEKERLTKKYKLTPYLKRCADYLSESAYIRQYRKEILDMTIWFIQPLLQEISKRLNLDGEELLYLWPSQVEKGLNGKIVQEKLKSLSANQKKFSVVVVEKGKILQLSGKKAREYFAKQETGEEELKQGILTGRPVFLGKAKGFVRVITGPKDFNKFNKGNILVATQTPPEFIPVISKARAVVVDEGGVTSHASLLCRELKIIGIIGTKIATKVLKDGDLVEVDAEKGIVKILEKAK